MTKGDGDGRKAHRVTQSWTNNSLRGQGIVNTGKPDLFHGLELVHELWMTYGNIPQALGIRPEHGSDPPLMQAHIAV